MYNTKGTDIQSLKKIMHEKGAGINDEFLQMLSPELKEFYEKITYTKWNSFDKIMEIYEAAPRILFPDDPHQLFKLGKVIAERSYSTIYRIFLRLPTVNYVMKSSANIFGILTMTMEK